MKYMKEGGQESRLHLLVARVDRGSSLWCTGLQSVVKAAVIVGLYVQVAVHTVADLQLRPVKTLFNITGQSRTAGGLVHSMHARFQTGSPMLQCTADEPMEAGQRTLHISFLWQ